MTSTMSTLLEVVAAADNFPQFSTPYPTYNARTKEKYVPLYIKFADYATGKPPVGLLRPEVLEALDGDEWQRYSEGRPDEEDTYDLSIQCVFFSDEVVAQGGEGVSRVLSKVNAKWREGGMFRAALDGWRNELYKVYTADMTFECERSACAIFGFCTYGVHMIAYEGEGSDMKVWVPRRSRTKPTWPGMLDNTVAGGIPSGMTPLDTLVKECDEEASLDEGMVRKNVKSVGFVTYLYLTDAGFIQPDFQYTYDLKLNGEIPRPHDDEVESFELHDIPSLRKALLSGDFKPNCGLVFVDFLIRHGIVTAENEPDFFEIGWRCHRRIGLSSC